MIELLKELCAVNAPSGRENNIRDYIIRLIKDYAEITVDPLGSIIAQKKNGPESKNRVMIDAHIDEVGFIVTSVCNNGLLKFDIIGSMDETAFSSSLAEINGHKGAVVGKPVHFINSDEKKKPLSKDGMFIDIGAENKEQAEKIVSLGDCGVFCGNFCINGDTVRAKALDDRVGAAIIIDMLKDDSLPKFTATFTVGEEVGARGAGPVAYSVCPDYAIMLESTTASDIHSVTTEKCVCRVGGGPVVSFMDKCAIYDRELYRLAGECKTHWQTKTVIAGGNNSGTVQRSVGGVPVMVISLPCRYIHSPNSLGSIKDFYDMRALAGEMLDITANK